MLKDMNFSARECLEKKSLDAIIVTSLPNIRYLTRFTGSDGVLIITAKDSCFLTDSRYTSQASMEVCGTEVIEYKVKIDAICRMLSDLSARRVGFEDTNLSVSRYQELAEKLPLIEFVPLNQDLDQIRECKSEEEIASLQRSAEISSEALLEILPLVRSGAVERDLALELEVSMLRRGADNKSFDFIVASGARGALPHGKASNKIICKGEMVTFDFGAFYDGYASDETVTVAIGKPDSRLEKIYNIVRNAQSMAIDFVKPGVKLSEVDNIARSYIKQEGFADFFGHGLGHGIGLEVHEKPIVSFRSESVAKECMVFTIEPGIYLPGVGGVRLEDTVVVTATGCRLLTKVSKELRVL